MLDFFYQYSIFSDDYHFVFCLCKNYVGTLKAEVSIGRA